jgi:hypothetical protein
MKFCHFQVTGWNWRTSSYVKIARFRTPKAACFLSYVEIKTYYKCSNIMKNRSHKGEVTYEMGSVKEGS